MSKMQIVDVDMGEIHDDEEFNCRGNIAPISVVDLAKDIQERGLIQPVVIQPCSAEGATHKYRLLAGFRRFMAYKVNKQTKIPCIIRDNIISESDAMFFNLSENIQRKDLNILQESMALKKLRDLGISETLAAEKLGKSRGWIQVRYMILDFPADIQNEVAAGYINQTQIRDLYSIKKTGDTKALYEAAKTVKAGKLAGQSISLAPTKPLSMKTKKQRNRAEIFQMMGHMTENLPNGLYTRTLAWAAGEITNADLFVSIQTYAKNNGYNYSIPTSL